MCLLERHVFIRYLLRLQYSFCINEKTFFHTPNPKPVLIKLTGWFVSSSATVERLFMVYEFDVSIKLCESSPFLDDLWIGLRSVSLSKKTRVHLSKFLKMSHRFFLP